MRRGATGPALGRSHDGPVLRRLGVASVATGLAVGLLAGCAVPSPPDGAAPRPVVDPTAPAPVTAPAPAADVDPGSLPYAYLDSPAVAPGWEHAPVEADGLFVGVTAPVDGAVDVVAVDASGTELWRARQPEDVRITLSHAEDALVVVLTAAGSVAAYDRDGTPRWGPQDLDGELVGPGLVVRTPEGRRALDASTGAVVPTDGGEVLAERDGTVVVTDGPTVRALHAGTVWEVPRADLALPPDGPLAAVAGSVPPPGTVLLGAGEAPEVGTLVDLADGRAVATEVRDARLDPLLRTWVALGERELSGHGPQGPLWSRAVPDGASLAGTGGALVHLRVGDRVLVVNTATGAEAQAYDPAGPAGLLVPATISAEGAAAAQGDRWLLLTVPEAAAPGTSPGGTGDGGE